MKEETQPSHENNGKHGICVSAAGSIGRLGTKNRRRRGPYHRKVTFWNTKMACEPKCWEDNRENDWENLI